MIKYLSENQLTIITNLFKSQKYFTSNCVKLGIILMLTFSANGCLSSLPHIKSILYPNQKKSTLSQQEPSHAAPVKEERKPPPSSLHVKDEEMPVFKPEKIEKIEFAPTTDFKVENPKPSLPEPKPDPHEERKKTDQELLDSALSFCQASNDFWEQGDIENAITALDQAYSLILKINIEGDPEILQQREDLRFTISKRITEVYSSRFTVADGLNGAIPLDINKEVKFALSAFKGKERNFFLAAYKRSGRYRPYIIKALKDAGLPVELSWLPLIESGFKVKALSKARALGMWQFIASTGYKYGLKRDKWVDERMDPEKSTLAAIAYLKELHSIFGDWTTAIAAYNCGEWRVLRCIRTQKINYLDNFWDLYKKLPRETAFYVPKFLAVLNIINNPEAHGFSLPPVDREIKTEVVTTSKQAHLKNIAEHIQVSFNVLKNINPSLRHNYTPARPFLLKVPRGKGEELLSKLDDISVWRPPLPSYVVHKVRKGEALSIIARRYRTSVKAIIALNRLKRRHFIKAGQRLKIPTKKKYVFPKRILPAVSAATKKGRFHRYKVKKGDSLWNIARKFGTTTYAIKTLNNLKDANLQIGQLITIPHGITGSEEIKTTTYKVLKGDSPYNIAHKHNMDLSEFLALNQLTPRSTIFPGQILFVKAE